MNRRMGNDRGMTNQIRRLIGVYDADGTLRGELTYWVNARFGKAHCALCDITHGLTRTKREWKECRSELPVEFATFHRDDQPAHVRTAADGVAPVVVAETDDGVVVLLGPTELDACHGSPEGLMAALDAAIAATGLTYPAS